MLIHSIEIFNFRQFYGRQQINFSIDPKKNITLIHAENGVGKTALLNTILWCLYEKITSNFEGAMQNDLSFEEGKKSFHVYLTFQEDNRTYVAQRALDPISQKIVFKVFEISQSGNHTPISNADVFINSVVPKDMSDYFFFKGEGDDTISVNSGEKIREAIRDILGLTIAERVLEDLGKVRTDYRKEFKKSDSSKELGEIHEKIAKLDVELAEIKGNLQEEQENRGSLVEELQKVRNILKNSDNELVKEKQKSRESKERFLDDLINIRKEINRRKVGLISRYAISAFSHSAASKGIDFIDQKKEKKHSHKISSPHSEGLVNDIVTSGTCICGRDIEPGTEYFGNIKKLLETAGDPKQENRIRRARSQLTVVNKDLRSAESDFKTVMDELSKNEKSIRTIEGELGSLSIQIKGLNDEDMSSYEDRLTKLGEQLQSTNQNIGRYKDKIETAESRKSSYLTDERKHQSSSSRVKSLRRTIAFIDTVYEQLSSEIEDFEESSKRVLAEKINTFLEKYARKSFHAKINQNYEIILFDQNDRIVTKSDGEKLLLGLTFISSLISFAKERKNASGDILTPGAVAPFVVDAPFGDLDKEYKKSVATELPKSVNQMVLLLSSSHWEGEVEDAIRERVGKEYNLVFQEPDDKGLKNESFINILGQNYPTVRYSADKKMTSIEEVVHGR